MSEYEREFWGPLGCLIYGILAVVAILYKIGELTLTGIRWLIRKVVTK